ncbi:MAG: hypothetical protein EOR03_21665 [Mesorhizobium sp.]|nr:MAG: hypothetical protein EOR03_21665 [Mesorhizobium sp.]
MHLKHLKRFLFPEEASYQIRIRRGVSGPALVVIENDASIRLLGNHHSPPARNDVGSFVRVPSPDDERYLIEHATVDICLHREAL